MARHCDLIVGNCGYMYAARTVVHPDTPTLLSGLQLLPNALESSRRPVGILTFNQPATEKMLAGHPDRYRLRIVGLDRLPGWSAINDLDFVISPRVSAAQLRAELLDVCLRERRVRAFTEIGALILECTAMPQFSATLLGLCHYRSGTSPPSPEPCSARKPKCGGFCTIQQIRAVATRRHIDQSDNNRSLDDSAG